VTTRSALALIAVTATAATGTLLLAPATSAKPTTGKDTGIAQVFMVNPVQSSNDQTLTDDKDAASAVPSSAYALAPLRNLDGSGYLRGKWVTVESGTGTPAYSRTGEYLYTRDQDQFEQVMGYFWVNQAQEYLQSLGFGSTLRGIIKEPFSVKINQFGGDNSYQTDKPYRIRLGKGGVDDAEDAEVIVHEYGHAVHQSQVPGYGQSADAGAIGESFGDYLAVTVGLAAAAQYGWPVAANLQATAVGGVHFRSQVWSQALWEIRLGYVGLKKTTAAWDTTLIDSQFDYAADTSFSAAAKATYDTALARDGQAAATLVKARFAVRGITF
jgi:hypothetical protein